jgi:hypothetical protein
MSEVRDKLRSQILATHLPKSKVITFFGGQIEIRQPSLKDILAVQASAETDREGAIIRTLIMYAFVPGTNDRVFEDSDKEQLQSLPWGQDFVTVTEVMQELTSVNFGRPKQGSDETVSNSSSSDLPGNSGVQSTQ